MPANTKTTYNATSDPSRDDHERPPQPPWSKLFQGHEVLVENSENVQHWLFNAVRGFLVWQREAFRFSEDDGRWTHTQYFFTIGMDKYSRCQWGKRFVKGLCRCEINGIEFDRRSMGVGWSRRSISYPELVIHHLEKRTVPKLIERLENCYSVTYHEWAGSKAYNYVLSKIDESIEKFSKGIV